MDSDQMQAAADRLAGKLDALDLDDDERTVLVGILGAGADSIEPVDDEVDGFAFDAFLGVGGGNHGSIRPVGPAESLSLNFGQIQWTYTQQKPDGSAPAKQK